MPSHILVVGSLAYDDVQTPYDSRSDVLGGAASYFSLAACLYAPVRLMGVVGADFREGDLERLRARGIDRIARRDAAADDRGDGAVTLDGEGHRGLRNAANVRGAQS